MLRRGPGLIPHSGLRHAALRAIGGATERRDESSMADQGAQIDLPAHERSYGRFLKLMRNGAIACFLIGLIVMLIISR